MRKSGALGVLTCLGLGLLVAPLQAQAVAEMETIALIKLLNEPIETKDFVNNMTLRDAVGLLYEKFANKGKDLPFVINRAAFREDQAMNNFDPNETQVSLPPLPRVLPVRSVLQLMLAEMPHKATFLVRDGRIEIVPEKLARAEQLLQQKVMATFTRRPLSEALQELSAQTGVSIVFDVRQDEHATKQVTATFRNNVTLRDALVMLADMTGLRADFMPSGVYITAPAKDAKR